MKKQSSPQHLAPAYIWYQIVGSLISLGIVIIVLIPIMIVSSVAGAETGDPSGVFAGMLLSGVVFSVAFVSILIKILLVNVSYKRFTYELKEDVFAQQQGVLNVTSVSIPYDRIQDVVIQRTFVMRWFGLSRLNIQNASGGNSYGMNSGTSLPGLEKSVAEKLQTELINRSKQARSKMMGGGAL